jgi:UDP-N-acetylmuramoyl-tripeptide--D-alanyl-D-alanine ligase
MLPLSPLRVLHGLGSNARLAQAGREQSFTEAGTDTRALRQGALFFALQGAQAGERYFSDALKAGARGLVGRSFSPAVRREARRRDAWLFQVPDGLGALQALASDQRRFLGATVVGVTGSNGKTSTKDLLAWLLEEQGAVLATQGNFNNHIGLPLTLLRARPGLRWAVLEVGMNHAGELAALGRILRPDLALVLNVGDAHAGNFRDGKTGVARAKEELVQSLSPTGIAVLNAGDPACAAMARRHRGRSILFGQGAGSQLLFSQIRDRGARGLSAMAQWTAPLGGKPRRLRVRLSQGGWVRREQAAAALATALALGADPAKLEQRLATWKPETKMRLELKPLRSGSTRAQAILDAYNASPQSMNAALDFLARSAPQGRRLGVLGSMLELGKAAPALHRALGRQAKAQGLRALAAVGPSAGDLAQGFGPGAKAFSRDAATDAAAWLKAQLRAGDWVLFKGSRGMAVERVYDAMQGA